MTILTEQVHNLDIYPSYPFFPRHRVFFPHRQTSPQEDSPRLTRLIFDASDKNLYSVEGFWRGDGEGELW